MFKCRSYLITKCYFFVFKYCSYFKVILFNLMSCYYCRYFYHIVSYIYFIFDSFLFLFLLGPFLFLATRLTSTSPTSGPGPALHKPSTKPAPRPNLGLAKLAQAMVQRRQQQYNRERDRKGSADNWFGKGGLRLFIWKWVTFVLFFYMGVGTVSALKKPEWGVECLL